MKIPTTANIQSQSFLPIDESSLAEYYDKFVDISDSSGPMPIAIVMCRKHYDSLYSAEIEKRKVGEFVCLPYVNIHIKPYLKKPRICYSKLQLAEALGLEADSILLARY